MTVDPSIIKVEYLGRVAVVTIDNDRKLNALNQMQYYNLAQKLREVATYDEVYITVLIGKGQYFSAGADVSISRAAPLPTTDLSELRLTWLRSFVANNLYVTQAFYSHPKVLVAALDGLVVGLSAALVAYADFVYAVPHTFLLTPFSSLGLVAEGGASRALVARLGAGCANEALLISRRIPAAELLAAGFVTKVFEGYGKGESDKFRALVLREIDERLGEHLVWDSLKHWQGHFRDVTEPTLFRSCH